MIADLPRSDVFRTTTLRGLPAAARVDHATKTIFGIKAMEVGPLNEGDSRPWKIDEVTLQQAQRFATAKNGGVKMRFAHPNMSRDGMGRHVGRATNARLARDENGTPYLAVDATLNAKGGQRTQDMVSHILDLSENAPEDFGVSLAPLVDHEVMSKIQPDENGLVPVRLKGLNAIDFVDEPAATRGGLFDLHSEELQDLPAQATNLLDTFFANAQPDVIRQRFGEFLDTYLKNRGPGMSHAAQPNTFETPEEIAAIKAENEALRARIAAMEAGSGEGGSEGGSDQPAAQPSESEPMPMAQDPNQPQDLSKPCMSKDQQDARAELQRVGQIDALCKLAGVPADRRDLMVAAGFSRQEAQDYLAKSGFLGGKNPPIDEPAGDLKEKKPTPEETFGKEYDAQADALSRIGVSREAFIKSRLKDAA